MGSWTGMGRQEDRRLDEVGSGDRRRLWLLAAINGSAGGCIQLPSGRSSQRIHLCRCWRSLRENLNHVRWLMQPFLDTLRFFHGARPPKSPPYPYLVDGGVCGALKRRVGDPLWLAGSPTLLNSGQGAPFFPAGSTPIQRHLITHLNHIRPLFLSPHPSQRWTHWHMRSRRSPALQNLHPPLDFGILSGISVPKQASRGAR